MMNILGMAEEVMGSGGHQIKYLIKAGDANVNTNTCLSKEELHGIGMV